MNKLSLFFVLFYYLSSAYSQQNVLVFKKRNKTIDNFWNGSTIAFQDRNKQWQKGEIIKIQNDSFYIRPVVVKYYLMGTDTIRFPVSGFSISDVYSLPKKGVLVDYKNG